MDNPQIWKFTCHECGGHQLNVTHEWNILAGPESESWQEWGPLEDDHHWSYKFKEKIEPEKMEKMKKSTMVVPGILLNIQKMTLLPGRKLMKNSNRTTTMEMTSFM